MRAGQTTRRLAVVVAAVLSMSTGCITDAAGFLEDIGNLWSVDGEAGHTFFFLPQASGRVSSTTFDGREELPNGDSADLSGLFDNRDIRFTSRRKTGDVIFSGTFRDESTMELQSGGRTLVVRKGV